MSYKKSELAKFRIQKQVLLELRYFFGSDEKLRQAVNAIIPEERRLGNFVGKRLSRSALNSYINKNRKMPFKYARIISKLTGIRLERLSPFEAPTDIKLWNDLLAKNRTFITWKVARIIVQPDFYDPIQTVGSSIIVSSNGVLISGLATLQAYQAQGKTSIDAIVVDLDAFCLDFSWDFNITLADFNINIPFVVSQQSAIGMALQKKLSKCQGARSGLKEEALLASKNLEKDPSLRSLCDEVRDRSNAWMANILNFSSKDEYLQAKKIYKHAPESLILAVDGKNGKKVPITVAASMLDEPGALEAFEQAQAFANAYKVPKTRKKKECHDETLC